MRPQDEPDEVKRADSASDHSLQRFEADLAALSPRAAALDRDRMMFLAGQASASLSPIEPGRRGWAWPAAFSAMTALAASLLIVVALRPAPRVVEKIVYLTQEKSEKPAWSDTNERKATTTPATSDRLATVAPPSASAKRLDQSYLGLRDRVLAMGIESWPSSRNSGGSEGGAPASYRDLLDSLLHDG